MPFSYGLHTIELAFLILPTSRRIPASLKTVFQILALSWAVLGLDAVYAKDEVHVGIFVQDIQYIELKSHSYAVDFYVWFKWKNPKINPADTLEFTNPFEKWGHTLTKETEVPTRLPDGSLYQVIRCQGRFSKKFNLERYPFDRQELKFAFEDQRASSHDLIFVTNADSIKLNPELTIPGYVIEVPSIRVQDFKYPSDFGDSASRDHVSSRVSVMIPVHRPLITYTIKLLVPILCVILSSALMFLFNPMHVDSRVGIGITGLLTIVALQITLNEDLPEIDYLVLIDKIYLCGYFFVIAGLALVVKTTWMHEKGETLKAAFYNRRALAILTSLYVLVLTVLILTGL
jgi:hypothetical protein